MHRFHRGEAGARWTDREDAAWDLLPVLEALSYAHESGIWHRDVKPSNILLREGLGGALADFGLAKDSMDGEVTRSGVFKGSVKYVSPEQARARMRLVDHRSDIFSCGLVLFEALSGEHAYAAQNEFQILEQIAVDEPRMLDEVWDDAPASLVAICYWALRPDREERYQSILEFANDLRAALEGKPVSVSLPDWKSHVARFVRRNRARLVGTLFIFAVLASAIAAYVIMSRPPTSPVNVVSTAEGHEVLVQEHNPASGRYGEAWMVGRTPVRVDLPEGQYRFTVIAPDGAFSEVAGVVHANDADVPFSLEYPTRDEVIERDYWIDRREVTNAQFAAFLDATGREPIASTFREIDLERYGDFPVVNVTWDEATAYAKWVGKRLPTAKEWERAARGTDGRSLPWGIGQSHADSVAARASIGRASLNDIAGGHDLLHLELGSPVGSHPFDVSPDGLFDVLGGVSEFVENRPLVFSGEELLVSDRERMYMGNSWKWKSESVHLALFGTLADSHRGFDDAVGFRCAKSSAPVAKAR
jgi:formylglycine-generating enzyme required for sulfatase activity